MHTLKNLMASAAALAFLSVPALAQDASSVSGSGAEANSGSISGSSADGNQQQQGQSQNNIGGNNAGIGNSASRSNSNSDADSASTSYSGAASDQHQSLANDSRTTTSTTTAQTQGQSASNMQGVATNITFNSTNRKHSYVGTNTPVMLAASSSFSSDFCGSTASGGASVAPIGVSIGGSGPKYDKSCQSLRRAEKFGMAAANWHNLGYDDRAVAMMRMMEWSICTSDTSGPKGDTSIAEACDKVLAMAGNPPSAPVAPTREVTPMETQQQNVTPAPDYSELPPKTPRGELTPPHNVAVPMAAATLP